MSKARVVSENIMGREHIPLIALSPIFLLPSHRISIHNFKLDTPMRRIKNALASFSKNQMWPCDQVPAKGKRATVMCAIWSHVLERKLVLSSLLLLLTRNVDVVMAKQLDESCTLRMGATRANMPGTPAPSTCHTCPVCIYTRAGTQKSISTLIQCKPMQSGRWSQQVN